jgi:hypothetical protein
VERVKESKYGGCTLCKYENRTTRSIEIVLRRGEGEEGE